MSQKKFKHFFKKAGSYVFSKPVCEFKTTTYIYVIFVVFKNFLKELFSGQHVYVKDRERSYYYGITFLYTVKGEQAINKLKLKVLKI